jgi:hypothetical protein
MEAPSDMRLGTIESALETAVSQGFYRAWRPAHREMFRSSGADPDGPWDRHEYDGCLQNVLVQYHWLDVQLDNFRVDDDCLFFKDREEQAEWAAGVCDLLSDAGIGYYAPAVILIVLEEGAAARPLLEWLVGQLDPEWVGENPVEKSFGRWNANQIDVLLEFLDWAFREIPCGWYDGQPQAVRLYWERAGNVRRRQGRGRPIRHRSLTKGADR